MKDRSWLSILSLTAIVFVLFFQSLVPRISAQTLTAPETADSSSAYKWLDVVLEATAREHDRDAPRPTIGSRMLMIMTTAMYDAWAAYDDKAVGTRLGGSLRRPESERTTANKKSPSPMPPTAQCSTFFRRTRNGSTGKCGNAGSTPMMPRPTRRSRRASAMLRPRRSSNTAITTVPTSSAMSPGRTASPTPTTRITPGKHARQDQRSGPVAADHVYHRRKQDDHAGISDAALVSRKAVRARTQR